MYTTPITRAASQIPKFSPEIADRICIYLPRTDLVILTLVSRFFFNIARWRLMSAITIEPHKIDLCERYITAIVEHGSKPPLRHMVFDVAVPMYQILYSISKACSGENTRSLCVTSSIRFADWPALSTVFVKHLSAHVPTVKTLQIKPVDSRFQFALTSAYSSTLVKLTLYSAIARTSFGWSQVAFPCLEDITLVQDHPISEKEDSLPLLLAKFAVAPKLKRASIIAVVEGGIFGVYEFLLAFGVGLQLVKILGEFFYETPTQRLLPKLLKVTCFHVEATLVHCFFMHSDNGPELLPQLQQFVIEGNWKTLESGSPNVRWAEAKRTLTHIAGISPKPTIICGYRGGEICRRAIFSRSIVKQLFDVSGWDIRGTFRIEERRCDDLPPRRLAFADVRPGYPVIKRTPVPDTSGSELDFGGEN